MWRLLAILLMSCGRTTVYEAAARSGDAGTTMQRCAVNVTFVGDVMGRTVFASAVPPGRYRITYVDGCMKYASGQDWAVNAYAAGPDNFWLVDGAQQKLLVPPGTVGFFVGSGGFATFDECVEANRALGPLELDFAGGKLGVWLQDDPYTDNVAGEDGRNPAWNIKSLKCD